jgi:ABC-type antimicrobial peptide transport system permease subunit
LEPDRLVAFLSGAFAVLTLLLAVLGLYGVTAYATSGRRAEFAIRLALGATPPHIVRLAVTRVSRLVVTGIIIGLAVTFWASRFVAALVYGVTPRDPLTLASATLILGSVATLAAWLPARRACRIDPAAVLREQ